MQDSGREARSGAQAVRLVPIRDLDASMRWRLRPFDPVNDPKDAALFVTIVARGIENPLTTLRRKDGRLTITAGYRRLDAAMMLGYERVPCTVIGEE